MNQYLREVAGEDFTSKAKSNILRAIDKVSEQLNNTRAICRKYYIHPAILESYQAGTMLELLQNGTKVKGEARLDVESEAAICNGPATV